LAKDFYAEESWQYESMRPARTRTAMKTSIKKPIHQLLGLVGLKVSRTRNDEPRQIVRGLLKYRIDVALDVGSNTGQFAKSIRDAGYRNKIVCFEPLSDAY
jgi:hypothetical protein